MFSSTPDERLNLEVTQEQYDKIKNMWINHVELEAAGKLEQAIAETMTDDCVYEIVETGEFWTGQRGALDFYKLLGDAFDNVQFELLDVVVGPQGVFAVANMTGTQKKSFAGYDQSGQEIVWRLINLFSWDSAAEKFAGERLYRISPLNTE